MLWRFTVHNSIEGSREIIAREEILNSSFPEVSVHITLPNPAQTHTHTVGRADRGRGKGDVKGELSEKMYNSHNSFWCLGTK